MIAELQRDRTEQVLNGIEQVLNGSGRRWHGSGRAAAAAYLDSGSIARQTRLTQSMHSMRAQLE